MANVTVGIADLNVVKAPDSLITYALGSSVGIRLYDPEKKIDYIFYRDLTCKNVTTVSEIVSDHFPIIAEFCL